MCSELVYSVGKQDRLARVRVGVGVRVENVGNLCIQLASMMS